MQRNNQLATCIAVNLLWSPRCNKHLPIQKPISFSVIIWSCFLRRFLKYSCKSVSICNVNIIVCHGNETDFFASREVCTFCRSSVPSKCLTFSRRAGVITQLSNTPAHSQRKIFQLVSHCQMWWALIHAERLFHSFSLPYFLKKNRCYWNFLRLSQMSIVSTGGL